jgi:hypothetical protein
MYLCRFGQAVLARAPVALGSLDERLELGVEQGQVAGDLVILDRNELDVVK